MKRIVSLFFAACAVLTIQAQNPYLPLWEHLPDGEPRVFDDPDNPGQTITIKTPVLDPVMEDVTVSRYNQGIK